VIGDRSRPPGLRAALLAASLALYAPALLAQGPGFAIGRFFTDTGRTTYRLGYSARLLGPLAAELYGTMLQGRLGIGNFWGAGVDLSLFRGGKPGWYLVGGVSGGVTSHYSHDLWSSWSAGGGYELLPFGWLSIAGEGRWRVLNPGHHDGAELSLRIGLNLQPGPDSRKAASAPPAPGVVPDRPTTLAMAARAGVPADRAATLASVVETATGAMGTPYQWGGSGADGQGFDCSGLIRYAYGHEGIELPRTSAEQARVGRAVDRSIDALVPGDILTFSSRKGSVTHVGLYVGDGRFIHSANGGVQISVLSADDIYGKWWWKRWVGVRRVIE